MRKMLIAAVLALGTPPAASAADLSGTWAVKTDLGPRFKYTLLCALSADSGHLSGPCAATTGPILRSAGHLVGDRMRFGYDTDYNGSGPHLDYRGTVQPGGTVKGTVENRLATGAF